MHSSICLNSIRDDSAGPCPVFASYMVVVQSWTKYGIVRSMSQHIAPYSAEKFDLATSVKVYCPGDMKSVADHFGPKHVSRITVNYLPFDRFFVISGDTLSSSAANGVSPDTCTSAISNNVVPVNECSPVMFRFSLNRSEKKYRGVSGQSGPNFANYPALALMPVNPDYKTGNGTEYRSDHGEQ